MCVCLVTWKIWMSLWDWNYRRLWGITWVLGPQPVSSARTAVQSHSPGPCSYTFAYVHWFCVSFISLPSTKFLTVYNCFKCTSKFQKVLLLLPCFPWFPCLSFLITALFTLKDNGDGWHLGHFSGRTFTSVSRLRRLNQALCWPNSFIYTKRPPPFPSYCFCLFFRKHCVVLLSAFWHLGEPVSQT